VAAVTITQVASASLGVLIAVAAFATAVGVIAKSGVIGAPLRWLWRRNVSQPIGEWHCRITGEVVDGRITYLMTHNNGGSSLKDLADSVARINDAVIELSADVEILLDHDAERDVVGRRYKSED
jgi:hypothetical protein